MKTIQTALSELLTALGFTQMAADVVSETDHQRLQRYARVIVKATPEAQRRPLVRRFALLRLV